MNLKIKKLMNLQEGTSIEVFFCNGRSFSGVITEKDESCIALQSESQEMIIEYNEISTYIVFNENNSGSNGQGFVESKKFNNNFESVSQNTAPIFVSNAISKDKIINAPFYVPIAGIDSSDDEIKKFLNSLEKPVLKKFKALYNKFCFNKQQDSSALVLKTLPEIYKSIKNDEILNEDYHVWTIFALMMLNAGLEYEKVMPIVTMSNSYALLASLYYLHSDYTQAYVYAVIAVLQDDEVDNKNILYTIILRGCLETNDAGGAIRVMQEKGSNQFNTDLLQALFSAANQQLPIYADYSSSVKSLSQIYLNNSISYKINNVILSNNLNFSDDEPAQEPEEAEQPEIEIGENMFETAVKEKAETTQPQTATSFDNIGVVSTLSWAKEKGMITNLVQEDEEPVPFNYSDIRENNLYEKIRVEMCSNARAKNIIVIFDVSNSKATNIRSLECKSASDIFSYARRISTKRSDSERFADAANLISPIIEKYEPKAEIIADYINNSLAYDNAVNTEESKVYLDRSLGLYRKYDKKIAHDLRYDTIIFSITTKRGTFKEQTACLEKLLAYDSPSIQQRMVYTSSLADAYLKEAESTDNAEYYEKARTLYWEWESNFYTNKKIYSTESVKKKYHNHILVNSAKCSIGLGDVETAEEILQRVIKFDPTIDVAIKLLHNITSVDDEISDEEDDLDSDENLFGEAIDDSDSSYDSDLPDLENIQPYCDVAGLEEIGITFDEALDYFFKIKGECKCVYSLTYLKALTNISKELFEPFYTAVSLALDNPIEKLSYSSNDLMLSFDISLGNYERIIPYCLACAAIRSAFYQTIGMDYTLTSLCASIQLSSDYPLLGEILSIMSRFKNNCGKGMDAFAKYRCLDVSTQESRINSVLKNIKDIYEQEFSGTLSKEYINQFRFKVTKSIVYKKGGILEIILRSIKDNDIDTFEENRKLFKDTFIRNGTEICRNNIQSNKIEEFIDCCWNEAGANPRVCERKTSDLMGSLRNNLRSHITNIVNKICDWCELYDNGIFASVESEGKTEYLKIQPTVVNLLKKLYECLTSSSSDFSDEELTGRQFLAQTVDEILRKITGEWNVNERKYYFADFLKSNYILLDNNFIPDLSSTFCSFPDFNIVSRLRHHFEDDDKSIEKNLENIYSRNKEYNNFGTAKLIEEYSNDVLKSDKLSLRDDYDIFVEQAQNVTKASYKQFIEYISLANAKGQIMLYDNFMCGIDDVVLYWFAQALKSKNFGFFFDLISACKEKVRKEASTYEDKLLTELDEMEKNTPELFRKEGTKDQVIEQIKNQNFLVAEDWMNRLRKDDYYNPSPSNIDSIEYLKKFWDEFESNYEASKDTGTTLKLQVNRGGYIPAKDKKGGMLLISSWLSNGLKASTFKIENILKALGWENIVVTDESTKAVEMYRAKFKNKLNSNKRIYSHPLSAFGTASVNLGFNVVCLYGYYTADRLIEKYKELDSVRGNKIILLDFALPASERRRLARKIKEMHFTNVNILVDRVVILYISNNYVTGANNKMLMAITMPFSYYQPYLPESNAPIPPEIFMGREADLLSIESPIGANLLYGGRQLGKTAILNKAASDINFDDLGRRAIVIDIRKLDYKSALKLITEKLSLAGILSEDSITDDWKDFESIMCKRLNDEENYLPFLLLMLDEADDFIKSSESNDYLPLLVLKNIQYTSNGRFKFVVAGLHNLVRFNREIALGNNSVITHFPYVNILPFNYNEARDLLTKPLSYLGFTFPDDNDVMISQILAATNYFPGLIQLYCKKLIEAMKTDYANYNEAETPPYVVTEEHIKKVLTDKSFLDEIKEKISITLTLDSDEGSYYYTLALIIALLDQDGENDKGYTASDIYKFSNEFDIDKIVSLDIEKIHTLLCELKDLNILKEIEPNKFIFSTKSFRDMLGSKNEVLDELIKIC